MHRSDPSQRSIAVIGSGLSGLVAAYARLGLPRGRRSLGPAGGAAPRGRMASGSSAGRAMLTPAIYRTRITHLRRAPVHHYFETRGYSWYVDVDELPQLPRWLRPFARFEASDHFCAPEPGAPTDTLRRRIDAFLADRGIDLSGGTVTALIQARVLGYVFNPVSLYWCHDAGGTVRHLIAEVHNTYGGRHAYLLPPDGDQPAIVMKKLYVSPFNAVDGHYLVRAPRPAENLDVRISLHRDNQPAFVATLRGTRRRAGVGELLRLQLVAPLAPLIGAIGIRIQTITLWLRRVPVVPHTESFDKERVEQS